MDTTTSTILLILMRVQVCNLNPNISYQANTNFKEQVTNLLPQKPELKLKKAAKKFGKFLGTAALATAFATSPFSVGFPKSVFQDKKIEFVRGAHAEEITPVSEVLGAIENTKKLIMEGKVREVNIELAAKNGVLEIAEWKIEDPRSSCRHTGDCLKQGRISISGVFNKFAKDPSTFVTASIYDITEKLGIVDYTLVKGYILQRPDDASQTVLVLACKDHLDFYVLNKEGKIEWIPIILKDVEIERKPEIIVIAQNANTEIGRAVILAIVDEKNYLKTINKTAKEGETAKSLVAAIIPKPNERPERSAGLDQGIELFALR